MTPFILSHYDSRTLYAGANMLFKSVDRGDNWKCISPDLSSNPGPERQGNVPFGTITDISESPIKQGLLYAGTDDGQLHVTKDDGMTWTRINHGLPNRWVSRVVASKYDEATVFLSLTGYRKDDFAAYLFMSTDYGKTWNSIVNNLPAESINVIREDPTDKDILYLGTELGAYCSVDKGNRWISLCNTLPTCAVHDLAVHAGTGDLIAGTHGRSVFVLHAKEIHKIKQKMAE